VEKRVKDRVEKGADLALKVFAVEEELLNGIFTQRPVEMFVFRNGQTST
jgi:hypothetical protein